MPERACTRYHIALPRPICSAGAIRRARAGFSPYRWRPFDRHHIPAISAAAILLSLVTIFVGNAVESDSRWKERDYDKDAPVSRDRPPPLDEYNAQPDSGGVIGGARGEQEYGISSGTSHESNREVDRLRSGNQIVPEADDVLGPGGVSEWSIDQGRGLSYSQQSGRRAERNDDSIVAEITRKLRKHPNLNLTALRVSVRVKDGEVFLEGNVDSACAKLRIEEIVEAMPGVQAISNLIEVRG